MSEQLSHWVLRQHSFSRTKARKLPVESEEKLGARIREADFSKVGIPKSRWKRALRKFCERYLNQSGFSSPHRLKSLETIFSRLESGPPMLDCRSPHNIIFRRVSGGQVDPAAVTSAESALIEQHCLEQVQRLQRKVGAELKRGRKAKARRYQRELWEGLPARLVAAWHGDRKSEAKRRRAKIPSCPPEQQFTRVWQLAIRLRNPHSASVAVLNAVPKANGRYRIIHSFNSFGIAKQKLFVNAIKPFASYHPSQFMLRRGRPAACESLLRTMNSPLFRNARVIQMDVKDCFPSISRQWSEEELPAPKAIIRNTLMLEGWTIVNRVVGTTVDRRGLPQGSAASSYVAEIVLADVLRCVAGQLEDVFRLHAYSDNVVGLIFRDTDEEAIANGLRNVFAAHRAGPFCITIKCTQAPTEPFRFLGYSFARSQSKIARAFLPDHQWQDKEGQYITAIADAEDHEELLIICSRLRSFGAAFALAPETRILLRGVIRFLRAELEFRARSRGQKTRSVTC